MRMYGPCLYIHVYAHVYALPHHHVPSLEELTLTLTLILDPNPSPNTDPQVVHPLEERTYTILVFIVGASFFSFIYGNIAQFIQSYGAAGVAYRKRMQDADEIARFYRITPLLQSRLRRHVEFTWAVTKGIDLDRMAGTCVGPRIHD